MESKVLRSEEASAYLGPIHCGRSGGCYSIQGVGVGPEMCNTWGEAA